MSGQYQERKEYFKQYREKNKERLQQKRHDCYEENKERISEYSDDDAFYLFLHKQKIALKPYTLWYMQKIALKPYTLYNKRDMIIMKRIKIG